jgi:hypothetical protein
MRLLRTILGLVILVILAHVALFYLGYGTQSGEVISAIFGLGQLLEAPATALINFLPLSDEQRDLVDGGFYVNAIVALGIYIILYILLGIGRRD